MLILFIILSSSINTTVNVHAQQTTSSNCNLKILIQVAYNTTTHDPEHLYLYDNDIKAKLISIIDGKEVGIIPTLRQKLEEGGCSVHIDWQFDTGRPRYWWKPEYVKNMKDANLISNYNIVIFLGHGERAGIKLTIPDPIPGKTGKTFEVNLMSDSHFQNKGWILFISCRVLLRNTHDRLYNDYPLSHMFTGSGNIKDLSRTYLLVVTGFTNNLLVGIEWGVSDFRGHRFYLDFFIKRLVHYLVDVKLNIKDAWFRASTEYATYLALKGLVSYAFSGPAVLYPKIYVKLNGKRILVYNPLSNIYKISQKETPRDVYLEYIKSYGKQNVIVSWQYEVDTTHTLGAVAGFAGFTVRAIRSPSIILMM